MNIAFIDAQNLYLGTRNSSVPWNIDCFKFRKYLKEKYGVEEAYYFLGNPMDDMEEVYDVYQKAGFIIKFREHSNALKSKKKGNVDTDIVFSIMKSIVKRQDFKRIVLVSGDGDYFKLIKFLIEEQNTIR
jgi:uncharacterized LabA/DUF88 family protein